MACDLNTDTFSPFQPLSKHSKTSKSSRRRMALRQRVAVLLVLVFSLVVMSSTASAAVVEHTFNVENVTVRKLCQKHVITAVNGTLPGPTIRVTEGDTLVVHVFNNCSYNVTIHW